MQTHSLELPADFDEYAWELEAKGMYGLALLCVGTKRYRLEFYDNVRLMQSIADGLKRDALFFEPNLIVVPMVTKADMLRAVESLVATGRWVDLVEEQETQGTSL